MEVLVSEDSRVSSSYVMSSGSTIVASGTILREVPGQPACVEPIYLPKVEFGPERFRESFAKIVEVVEQASQFGSPDKPGFYAAEIELRLEVMAGGELRVLGSGVEGNATGGIRVLFKRGTST
jgi:hypothetical protein